MRPVCACRIRLPQSQTEPDQAAGLRVHVLWLMLLRNEEDHLIRPCRQRTIIKLTSELLRWLLKGIDIDAMSHYQTNLSEAVNCASLLTVLVKRAQLYTCGFLSPPILLNMNENDFSRLPQAAQSYICELESRNRQLGDPLPNWRNSLAWRRANASP